MKRNLTATAVKSADTSENQKPYKLSDGGGMFLYVVSKHKKFWRYSYRFAGKQKTLSIGTYPELSLMDARQLHDEARSALAKGIDPSAHKKMMQANLSKESDSGLEIVAREWFAKFSQQWVESHASKIIRRLERDIFPWIGNRPIADIEPPEILQCLRRIEERGALETAHRAKQNLGQVFRYAVATGRVPRDITADLKDALPPAITKNFSAVTDPIEIGELMRAMEDYTGTLETRTALMLSAYLFTRPGELRQMEWTEIDFDSARWHIPAEKMKASREHIVPLSEQALKLLDEIRPLTGRWRFVFPSMTDKRKAMSNNTVRQALRRLGYDNDTMTAHGFRALASTRLYEMGYDSELIEKQLAHAVGNDVRRAYDRSQHIERRTPMMQVWADYLDELKAGGKVLQFPAKSG